MQFSSYIDNFFEDESRVLEDESRGLLPLKKEDIYMGNLCAFQFWQRIFKVQPFFWYLFITSLKTLDASSFSMVVVRRSCDSTEQITNQTCTARFTPRVAGGVGTKE